MVHHSDRRLDGLSDTPTSDAPYQQRRPSSDKDSGKPRKKRRLCEEGMVRNSGENQGRWRPDMMISNLDTIHINRNRSPNEFSSLSSALLQPNTSNASLEMSTNCSVSNQRTFIRSPRRSHSRATPPTNNLPGDPVDISNLDRILPIPSDWEGILSWSLMPSVTEPPVTRLPQEPPSTPHEISSQSPSTATSLSYSGPIASNSTHRNASPTQRQRDLLANNAMHQLQVSHSNSVGTSIQVPAQNPCVNCIACSPSSRNQTHALRLSTSSRRTLADRLSPSHRFHRGSQISGYSYNSSRRSQPESEHIPAGSRSRNMTSSPSSNFLYSNNFSGFGPHRRSPTTSATLLHHPYQLESNLILGDANNSSPQRRGPSPSQHNLRRFRLTRSGRSDLTPVANRNILPNSVDLPSGPTSYHGPISPPFPTLSPPLAQNNSSPTSVLASQAAWTQLISNISHVLANPAAHTPESLDMMENYEALLNLAERLGEAKPKGCTKLDLSQMPTYRWTGKNVHFNDQTVCCICMNDFSLKQQIRCMPCNHEFHMKCIDKWLKTSRTCPVCRSDVTSSPKK